MPMALLLPTPLRQAEAMGLADVRCIFL
jgi:hypothetical protein